MQPGETLCADRFRVTNEIGRGVFSCVIACTDTQAGNKAVAIKIIKNNETMKKAAEKELDILARLKADGVLAASVRLATSRRRAPTLRLPLSVRATHAFL